MARMTMLLMLVAALAVTLPVLEARDLLTHPSCPGTLAWAPSKQGCMPQTWCGNHGDCTVDRCKDPKLTFCQASKCVPPPPAKTPAPTPVSPATAQQACTNYATQTNNNLNTNNGDANSKGDSVNGGIVQTATATNDGKVTCVIVDNNNIPITVTVDPKVWA